LFGDVAMILTAFDCAFACALEDDARPDEVIVRHTLALLRLADVQNDDRADVEELQVHC
jgi:hypothetical protein